MRQEKNLENLSLRRQQMLRSNLNEKTKILSLIMDLKKKTLMNLAKYPMMCQIMDCLVINRIDFAASEKEKGEE